MTSLQNSSNCIVFNPFKQEFTSTCLGLNDTLTQMLLSYPHWYFRLDCTDLPEWIKLKVVYCDMRIIHRDGEDMNDRQFVICCQNKRK